VLSVGALRLRVEHHPGHSPGHVWIVEEGSGAIFVGDYVIADHPTNAGLERDTGHPTGRAQLLEQYTEGLLDLAGRSAPVLFPGHGPPITDHATVVARRLSKSERRTRRVLRALAQGPPTSASALGRRLYRDRMSNWEVVADLVGRLDFLVAQGRAHARLGEDGVWYFQADPI
jgi:glyoxylase-like metal-dependent hydrolase (beta-lactamase superfamily II)